jgi:hypothetical protein
MLISLKTRERDLISIIEIFFFFFFSVFYKIDFYTDVSIEKDFQKTLFFIQNIN